MIIADGDFVTDKLIGNRGNVFPFVDTLRWLIGEEDLSGNLTSEEDVPIEHRRDEDKIWFYSTTFAGPALIAILGTYIIRRRRKRAKAS